MPSAKPAGSTNRSTRHLQATRLLPDSAEAHNNLGIIHRQRGDLAPAIAAFEKAIALRPDYPQALNNLGSARRAIGQVDAALELLLRAVRLDATPPRFSATSGRCSKTRAD